MGTDRCVGHMGVWGEWHGNDTAGQVPAWCYFSIYNRMFGLLSVEAESLEVSRKQGASAGHAG